MNVSTDRVPATLSGQSTKADEAVSQHACSTHWHTDCVRQIEFVLKSVPLLLDSADAVILFGIPGIPAALTWLGYGNTFQQSFRIPFGTLTLLDARCSRRRRRRHWTRNKCPEQLLYYVHCLTIV